MLACAPLQLSNDSPTGLALTHRPLATKCAAKTGYSCTEVSSPDPRRPQLKVVHGLDGSGCLPAIGPNSGTEPTSATTPAQPLLAAVDQLTVTSAPLSLWVAWPAPEAVLPEGQGVSVGSRILRV